MTMTATLFVMPLHEFAHFLMARVVTGNWAEFLFSSVKYQTAFSRADGVLVVGAGLAVDIVVSVALAWFVWSKRERLTPHVMAVPIGISILLIIPAVASLALRPEDADLVKLSGLVLGGGVIGYVAVYGVYLAGICLPTYKWITTYRSAIPAEPVDAARLGLMVVGTLSGFGIGWAIRELLVAV